MVIDRDDEKDDQGDVKIFEAFIESVTENGVGLDTNGNCSNNGLRSVSAINGLDIERNSRQNQT